MKITKQPCYKSDKWTHCKHGKYAILMPVETTASALMKDLKETNDLKSFMSNTILEKEVWYEELDEDHKKSADENWLDHKAECDACIDNPCQ